MELDQSDLQILFILKRNSRISLTDLGKLIGMTPAAINYRLQKLIEKGLIQKFTIDIDYSKLTPNYQSYLVRAKIPDWMMDQDDRTMFQSTYFKEVYIVAEGFNFVGVTFPLASEQLQKLIHFIELERISEYTLVPIVSQGKDKGITEIRGENIQKIYCPECQKEMEGTAIIVEINETKLMGFCCDECRLRFFEKFNRIVNK